MTITHNKIIGKLQALDEYLGYLHDLQKVNKKSFLNDYHQFGLAEHYLHLSIEVLSDVAKLIIIAYALPRPEEQRDVFRVLHDKRVVSKKLYNQLIGASGFRNDLIHEYEKIDKERVYEYLQNNIQQFKEFKRQVLLFLSKKKWSAAGVVSRIIRRARFTVDFDSVDDKKVTVRDRDTMAQERVAIAELPVYLARKLAV